MEKVVLVDDQDKKLGLMERWKAHKGKGELHRAISVFLYRKNGRVIEILLQKRVKTHPLWPLFWSNTVCTHPRDGESYIDCGVRRLQEELGISIGPGKLQEIFKLLYKTQYNGDLGEFELDTVLVGTWSGIPRINKKLVDDYRWMEWGRLLSEVKDRQVKFTPWFREILVDRRLKKAVGAT